MNANTHRVNSAAGTIAPIKNVAACRALVETLINCPPHVPNIGMFSGFSGYGKTMAADYCRNVTGAVMIEVFDSWTRKKFCASLLIELGNPTPRGSLSDMMDEIIQRLGDGDDRLVIIDEAHTAVDRGMVELIRQINKLAHSPILLVGEELLPKKLAQYENADNLVLERVLAQPCDVQDARALARLYMPSIDIADDLIAAFVKETGGRARRIVSTLQAAQAWAINNGATALNVATYRGRIVTGALPTRHQRAA
ncbi:MAG: ATP-binding protein [Mesorhizobium sp.]|uniref:AAA family ATPase n=1 Tax=Mesorhizobium sp. TaxID=1871066 RepID=UPI000FE7BADD|nr:ATP-binding protein [Mesorhizobium sp.]RWG12263.1 MAG: ATP-binding protein [Mesorhizobium sp.]